MLLSLCHPHRVRQKFRCFVGFCRFPFTFVHLVDRLSLARSLARIHIYRCVHIAKHFNELTYIFIIFEIKINSTFSILIFYRINWLAASLLSTVSTSQSYSGLCMRAWLPLCLHLYNISCCRNFSAYLPFPSTVMKRGENGMHGNDETNERKLIDF